MIDDAPGSPQAGAACHRVSEAITEETLHRGFASIGMAYRNHILN